MDYASAFLFVFEIKTQRYISSSCLFICKPSGQQNFNNQLKKSSSRKKKRTSISGRFEILRFETLNQC